ncbi:MAG: hypothetical protein R3D00_29890 [Bacteroidia bacterium]
MKNYSLMKNIVSFLFKLVFVLIVLTPFSEVKAQSYHMENVIYLKNGSEIRGWILEQIPGEYVKIELVGGSILVYQQDEIEKITSEPTQYAQIIRRVNRKRAGIQYRDRGLYNFVTTGYIINEGRWTQNQLDFSFYYRAGYRFNQYLGVGLGTGIDEYQTGIIIPIMAEVTGDFLHRRQTPFYLAQVGYGYGAANTWATENFEGGLLYHAGLGFKIHTRTRVEWTFSLGYKSQQLTETLVDWWGWNGEPVRTVRERTVRGFLYQFSIGF